ncbi:hypothetical protein M3Y94_00386300 [Aphelenchoides besseyi]|nr:hypothetical protein M3Y94_00386300 [Aphelenchoides besseyi]KAI6235041.1 hypothetical protein M3Y95_00009400 [Aphelenchoides besseyi]
MARLNSEELLTPDEIQRLETLAKRKDEVIERIRVLEATLTETQREITSLGVEDLDSVDSFDDPKRAIIAFNRNPTKTVEKLISSGVLSANAKTVAEYLWNCEGITRTAIGEYITQDNDFSKEVLREFIFLQKFNGMDVLPALRLFLNTFKMSGEGQIVDRVMMTFADCYCEINKPSVFKASADCHIFLYAVMLLQTSLHNPNVKTGMKCAEFVKLCDCCNLPKDFLVKTYNDVKKHPFEYDKFAIATRGCLLRNATKKGFLYKHGNWAWKKRWCVLMEHCLFYFENEDSNAPRGIIPLENLNVRSVSDSVQHPYCLELYPTTTDSVTICKLESAGSVPKSSHNSLRLAAETSQEAQEWISAIEQSSWMDEYKGLIQIIQRDRVQTM